MSAADGPASRGATAGAIGTPPPVAARDGAAPAEPGEERLPRGGTWRSPARWWWTGGYAVTAVILFFCYLRESGTQPVTSDPASNALQAWDMLHGNWLLHGWTLTDVSFYTTELPEYILVEAVRGLGPGVVHISAALTYTLLVVLAGLVAKGRATGREGIVRVLIASGIMIAPQLGQGAFILLLAPDHTGTSVPLLVTWLVLDRAPRRWYTPVVIGVLLTWAQIGDRLVLVLGVAPLVLVCAVRACQGLVRRREPVGSSWWELSLGAAALVSVALASLVVKVLTALGGYRLQPLKDQLTNPGSLLPHVSRTVDGVLALFGAYFVHLSGAQAALAVLHFAGLCMAAVALWLGIRRFFRSRDLIVDVLTVAVVLNLLLYVVSTLPVTDWSTRQIAGVLPAGAVLAGRLLAGPVIRVRLLPVLAVVGAGYLSALGYASTQPQIPAVGQNLAGWLAGHHLTYGLTGYGWGNTTTLASGGKVSLRSATWQPDRVSPGPEEYDVTWYDPRLHYASFVVLPPVPNPTNPMSYSQVKAIFGPPQHTYHYKQYVIMTWSKNLLTDVR
jgi:hypothetical protein